MAPWRTSCQLIRRYPHTALLPLACLAVLITLGCVGVKYGIQTSANTARERALWEGKVAAESLQTDVQKGVVPILQFGEVISKVKDVPSVLNVWNSFSRALWQGAPASVNCMFLLYQGVQEGIVSDLPKYLEYPNGLNMLGHDFPLRDQVLAAITTRAVNMQGPYMINEYWMSFSMPVFISNTTENETWGLERTPTDCPKGLCWDPVTRTKFWGATGMAFSLEKLVLNNIGIKPLQDVHNRQLWKADEFNPQGPKIPISMDGTALPQPDDAVCVQFTMIQQKWELCLWDSHWAPRYMRWMYLVVVLGSLVIAALVFTVLLAWVENRALLHSLLPKEALDRIRAESEWTKSAYVDEDFRTIRFDTPAQHMLGIIATCLSGHAPKFPPLLAVREALQRSADVYRPTVEAMQTQMAGAEYLDAEVRTALVAQLLGQGPESSQDTDSPILKAGQDDTPGLVKHVSKALSFLRPRSGNQTDPLRVVHEDRTASTTTPSPRVPADPCVATVISNPASDSQLDSYQNSVPLDGSVATQEPLLAVLQQLMGDGNLDPVLNGCSSPIQRMAETPGSLFTDGQTCSQAPGKAVNQNQLSTVELVSMPLGMMHTGLLLPVAGRPASAPQALTRRVSSPMPQRLALAVLLDPPSCPQQQQQLQQQWRPRVLMTEVEAVLATADTWEFDAYALEQATNGHPLSVLGYWLLSRTDLPTWAHMDTTKLARFLQHVEAGYSPENPYHNARHAADVLQSMHVIMHRGGMTPGYVDRATMLACYMAAIIHDYQHKGRNNDFLVHVNDDLALLYNDRSPMENHHLAAAFALLKRPELACLSGLSKNAWNKFRKLVIDLILSTDMKMHFAVVGQFEALHSGDASLARNSGSSGPSMTAQGKHGHSLAMHRSHPLPLTPTSDNDRLLSLQMALKCADLGHLTAPLDTHLRWVGHLEQELFQQGDAERAAGLPMSPLCDRSKEGVTKSQVGFMDFVVMPLFRAFVSHFQPAGPLLKAVQRKQRYWLARDRRDSSIDMTAAGPGAGVAARPSMDSSHEC